MFDEYGNEIKYMQQYKLVYAIPDNSQGHFERAYYKYIFLTKDKVQACLNVVFDAKTAGIFAKNNNLEILK